MGKVSRVTFSTIISPALIRRYFRAALDKDRRLSRADKVYKIAQCFDGAGDIYKIPERCSMKNIKQGSIL